MTTLSDKQPSPWDAVKPFKLLLMSDLQSGATEATLYHADAVDTTRAQVEANHAEERESWLDERAELTRRLLEAQATVTAQETCEWHQEMAGAWTNGCASASSPQAFHQRVNDMWKHCPYCGKPLEITRLTGERR